MAVDVLLELKKLALLSLIYVLLMICCYLLKLALGVIIFGSVRFLPLKNNQTGRQKKIKMGPKPNRNRSKPTGFGSVQVRFFKAKTGKTYGYFSSFVMGF